MGTSRWGAGVSTLENLVFVVGGSNESSRLNSVECYDVATDQWSALPEMSVARNGVGVVTTGGVCVCVCVCVCARVHTTQIQYSISTHHGIAVGLQ